MLLENNSGLATSLVFTSSFLRVLYVVKKRYSPVKQTETFCYSCRHRVRQGFHTLFYLGHTQNGVIAMQVIVALVSN